MASTTFTTRDGYTYQYRSADSVLGIRIGRNAAERAAEQNHSPRGAVMRLAADLARYAADRTRDGEGNYRPAFTSNEVRRPERVQPRVTIENVLASERWYASHKRQPSQADLRTILGVAASEGEDALATLRTGIEDAVRGSSSDGERVRSAQARKARRERETAAAVARRRAARK